MKPYKHTQIGYSLLATYGLAMLVLGYIGLRKEFRPMLVAAMLVILFAALLFSSLTVSVDDRTATVRFGLPLVRKIIHVREIETAQSVKNPWYYLLGIRYTPHGWLFAVSGSAAVEIRLKSGSRFRIGTDDPQRLTNVLQQAIRASAELS